MKKVYTFEDTRDESVFELWITYEELLEVLQTKPEYIVQRFCVNIGDPVRLSVKKPPSDFQKYVLGPMHERVGAHSKIKESKFQIPREW